MDDLVVVVVKRALQLRGINRKHTYVPDNFFCCGYRQSGHLRNESHKGRSEFVHLRRESEFNREGNGWEENNDINRYGDISVNY